MEKISVSNATPLPNVDGLTETAAQQLSPAHRRRLINFVEYVSVILKIAVVLHFYTYC